MTAQAQDKLPWRQRDAVVRAWVGVPRAADAVSCDVLWRLPLGMTFLSAEEAGRHLAVYRVSDGRRVDNVYVRELSADRAVVAFEALEAGRYEVYYDPCHDIGSRAFSLSIWKKRNKPENYPDFSRLPKAEMTGVELREGGEKDNPYNVSATATETDAYFSRAKKTFAAYLVPADFPLNGNDRIPLCWAVPDGKDAEGGFFSRLFAKKRETAPQADTVRVSRAGKALVQVGLVGTGKSPCRVTVRHTSLPGVGVELRVAGQQKTILSPRRMRSVWMVVTASDSAKKGFYELSLRAEGEGQAVDLPFVLEVTDSQDGGEAENILAEFVSRIGAQQRAVGVPDEVNPRFPVAVYGDYEVRSASNTLSINPATALPLQIYSDGRALLSDPVLLVFSTANGIRKIGVKDIDFVRRDGGVQVWRGSVRTHDMHVGLQASLSAYGLVRYEVDVEALSGIDFRNITLESGFSSQVTRACYDTVCVEGRETLSFSPREGFSGLWLGGDRGGVFVGVDAEPSNTFYNAPEAAVTLYKGSHTGLIIGSGPLHLQKGQKISLNCFMQLLPADYAVAQAKGKNILVVPDTLPGYVQAGLADILALENPFVLLDGAGDKAADRLSGYGVGIVPYVEPFVLPSSFAPAQVLASMGYPYAEENCRREMRFVSSDDILPALEYLYGLILGKKYVNGVLLSPSGYNMENIRRYSLMRSASGLPLLVFLQEKGCDASLLGDAPWIDAVLTSDTLGAGTGDCLGALGGLAEYFRMPQGGDVLSALSFAGGAYADFSDSVSVARAAMLWNVRRELGLDTPDILFYPERSAGIPVRTADPFVKISAYSLPGKLVVVCRNTSPTDRPFVPEFDFGALGIKRWQVDRLEMASLEGLQQGRMLLLDDPVSVAGDATAVLVLRWAAK